MNIEQIVKNPDMSKSAKMRALKEQGKKVGEIAKLLGVRYQFVYNVVNRPLKRKA